MLALIQRVCNASVTIDNDIYSKISKGLLILCGFEQGDTLETAERLLNKCFAYRIFPDENDKMNLSLKDISAQALIVPQFTLVADTKRGLRPSFSKGMQPQKGKELFASLQETLPSTYHNVCFGLFGADMKVDLCNDGPVTFMLSSN